MILSQFTLLAHWMDVSFLTFTSAILPIGATMQSTSVIGSNFTVERISSIHHWPLKHTLSVHLTHRTITQHAIIFYLSENGLTSRILTPSFMVPSNLLPSVAAKPETVYAKMIGTSFRRQLPCSKTPYQLSTCQLIRFTLIEALTWHICQTYVLEESARANPDARIRPLTHVNVDRAFQAESVGSNSLVTILIAIRRSPNLWVKI